MSVSTHGSGSLPDTAKIVNAAGAVMFFAGTVPTDGDTGYAKGCVCLNTAGTDEGDTFYVNIGSATSANFNLVTVAADA
jgi:N-acetylneuraminic acid mutarotase